MSDQQLKTALDHLKTGQFQMGDDWENAHEICQANEGSPLFDWLHALVHRIEGDEANAGYWYRRAGKDHLTWSFEDEWQAIRSAAGTG